MITRRLPQGQTMPMPPVELADPICGLEAPECIEGLDAQLPNCTNLEPREIVRGRLANEGDRQALERGFGLIQHNLENGINCLQVHFSGPRNTADARLVARALQRLCKAPLKKLGRKRPTALLRTRRASRQQADPSEAVALRAQWRHPDVAGRLLPRKRLAEGQHGQAE
jgi:hypothetical protein